VRSLRNVKDVFWEATKSGSDTMLNILLNILWRLEEREKKDRAEENNGLHCIESNIIMNIETSIY
jgi:uncharacterized protein (UPF0335 family)